MCNRVLGALSQRNDHAILCMLARIHGCQVDGPMRDASKESLQKNSFAQDGVSLARPVRHNQRMGFSC